MSELTIVSLDELETGYEMMCGSHGEVAVYVSKLNGEVLWGDEEYGGEPCPVEDIDENDDYLHLPDKYDLDLGKPLVMKFAETVPEFYDEIRNIFSRRGAYGKFRYLLEKNDILEKWYEFEGAMKKEALVSWCERNGFKVKIIS